MALSENYKSAPVAGSSHAMTGLTLAATMLILGWVLKYSSYGIEFTDEGFHLVSISNPFIYDFSITQFGFVYHPLYVLLGGDIAALRQANILVTFALAGGWHIHFSWQSHPNQERMMSSCALPRLDWQLVFLPCSTRGF